MGFHDEVGASWNQPNEELQTLRRVQTAPPAKLQTLTRDPEDSPYHKTPLQRLSRLGFWVGGKNKA